MFDATRRPWMKMKLPGMLVLALAVLLTAGCGGNRQKTCYPVRGRVLVNGKAAKDVLVVFNPKVAEGERLAPNAQTDENGAFELSTYGMNDGAPASEYLATFTWREVSGLLKNQFDGPDRLKGYYNDPTKGLFPITIEKRPMELPDFNLEIK